MPLGRNVHKFMELIGSVVVPASADLRNMYEPTSCLCGESEINCQVRHSQGYPKEI
jgi:hypothetical protein